MSDALKLTPVVFFRDHEAGEVLAVFPTMEERRGLMACYAHLGQHSTCSPQWLAECCERESTDNVEVQRLISELQGLPYDYQLLPFKTIMHARKWAARHGEA